MMLNCRESVVYAGSAVSHGSVNVLLLWHLELFSVPLFLFVPLTTHFSITQIQIEKVKTFSVHPLSIQYYSLWTPQQHKWSTKIHLNITGNLFMHTYMPIYSDESVYLSLSEDTCLICQFNNTD